MTNRKKLPYQGFDVTDIRKRLIEEDHAKSKANTLEQEIMKLSASGDYAKVYEKMDELKAIYDRYSNLFSDGDCQWLKTMLIKTLTKEYEHSIKVEFEKRVDNAKMYYTIYDYKSSGYPGTYEEYAESRAVDSLLEETNKYRYGGYMHVVVLSVLTPAYRATRRREIANQKRAELFRKEDEKRALFARMNGEPIEERRAAVQPTRDASAGNTDKSEDKLHTDDTQAMIEEIRRRCISGR